MFQDQSLLILLLHKFLLFSLLFLLNGVSILFFPEDIQIANVNIHSHYLNTQTWVGRQGRYSILGMLRVPFIMSVFRGRQNTTGPAFLPSIVLGSGYYPTAALSVVCGR